MFQGVDNFKAKVNIEVQWASEPVIAAIEKNGGTITTAYYDIHCLHVIKDVDRFFTTGKFLEPIKFKKIFDNVIFKTCLPFRSANTT